MVDIVLTTKVAYMLMLYIFRSCLFSKYCINDLFFFLFNNIWYLMIFCYVLFWQFDELSLVWGKPRQPPLGFEEVWAIFFCKILLLQLQVLLYLVMLNSYSSWWPLMTVCNCYDLNYYIWFWGLLLVHFQKLYNISY